MTQKQVTERRRQLRASIRVTRAYLDSLELELSNIEKSEKPRERRDLKSDRVNFYRQTLIK